MTLEQAGAVVLIGLFAVFILWGRSAGGQGAVSRIFGSRRGPDPVQRRSRKTSSSGKKPGSSKTSRRTAARRGRAK